MILGLDLSLNHVGWAVLKSDNWATGLVLPKEKGTARLREIREGIFQVVITHKVSRAALEGYAYGRVFRAHDMGEVGGVVRLELFDNKIPFEIVAPPTLKKFVTGSGRAKKEQMLLKIYKKWGREFDSTDEAEAFAVAMWLQEKQ